MPIIVTENVAAYVTAYTNTERVPGQGSGKALTNTVMAGCYVPQPLPHGKRVWLILGAEFTVAMIHIVNNPEFLDDLVDIKISVGKLRLTPKNIHVISFS